jgi:hypothetical protein
LKGLLNNRTIVLLQNRQCMINKFLKKVPLAAAAAAAARDGNGDEINSQRGAEARELKE